jgi:molybdenum cofactor cytidylyltransferase
MPETWAIVLAAGKSERMGSNKLLMSFNGNTIIGTVIGNIMRSAVDGILVVLGAYSEELLPVISRMKVRHCVNEDYEKGMLTSVQCAFRNLPSAADSVLLFLGDQPAIPGEVADRLIQEYRKNHRGIIIPSYKGRRGHPVLIDKRYNTDIAALDPSTGLRGLMNKHSGDILEVETDFPGILSDIDTLQDLQDLITSK